MHHDRLVNNYIIIIIFFLISVDAFFNGFMIDFIL